MRVNRQRSVSTGLYSKLTFTRCNFHFYDGEIFMTEFMTKIRKLTNYRYILVKLGGLPLRQDLSQRYARDH